MTNEEIVQAIITNLEAILETTLEWALEDKSNKETENTIPLSGLSYTGERFEDIYGQRPTYNEALFIVHVLVNKKSPKTIRNKQVEYTHNLRKEITVESLNVGDLLDTNIIRHVAHEGSEIIYEPPKAEIIYTIAVKYREQES